MTHESIPAQTLMKDGHYWQVMTEQGKMFYLLPRQFIDKDGMLEGAKGYLTYKASRNLGAHYFTNQPLEG